MATEDAGRTSSTARLQDRQASRASTSSMALRARSPAPLTRSGLRRLRHCGCRRPRSHARRHPRRKARWLGQQGVHGRCRAKSLPARPASATSPSCPSTASTTRSTSACASATPAEVKTIWLTASGGPVPQTALDHFAHITPEQALKHPTWVMGRRITIDSATMLNKGLEVIEACRPFQRACRAGPRHRPSPVHGSLAGGVRRRLHPRADLRHRHAPAHPLRAGLPRAARLPL
jgi:hypothetical protein